jgi:hypothetical protein
MTVIFTIGMNYSTLSSLCWKLMQYRQITGLSGQYLYSNVSRERHLQNCVTETRLEMCRIAAAV